MPHVTAHDLQQLTDICDSVCYHLTAHLAAVATGASIGGLPPEVAQIYRLGSKLPKASGAKWMALVPGSQGPKAAAAAAATGGLPLAEGAKVAGKRMKWTTETESELLRLADDDSYREETLGKEGTRKGAINWAAVARHFGFSNGTHVKQKYSELKGIPVEKKEKKKKADGEGEEDGKPAKKAKKEEQQEQPAAKPAAGGNEEGGPTPAGGEWSKQQGEELVRLVEHEEERKKLFGKRKLRWKRIAEHFGQKSKACKKHYSKLTSKEAPSDEE